MFLQGHAQPEFPVLPLGLSCIGSVFSLPVVDVTHSDLPLSLHSLCHLGLFLFAPEYSRLGFSLLLQGHGQAAFSTSLLGLASSGSSSPILDFTALGSFSSLRSFLRCDSAASVLNLAHLGFFTSVRNHVCFDFLLPLLGVCRSESTENLSVLGRVVLGPLMFLRAFAQLGLVMFAVKVGLVDLFMSLHSLV